MRWWPRVLCQAPLGELTKLLQTLSWIKGRWDGTDKGTGGTEQERWERDRRVKEGEGRGRGKRRKRRGKEWVWPAPRSTSEYTQQHLSCKKFKIQQFIVDTSETFLGHQTQYLLG